MSEQAADDWRDRLVDDRAGIEELLRDVRRIAVLGIKTEQQSGQPAFYVPEYLQAAGYEIVPVPVYYPDVNEILGQPVYRRLADIPGGVDLVVVFRRPADVAAHLPDLLEAEPVGVWMQAGIRQDEVAERLATEGVRVVQDRCIMVEHRRMG